jgi:hypothetical protein
MCTGGTGALPEGRSGMHHVGLARLDSVDSCVRRTSATRSRADRPVLDPQCLLSFHAPAVSPTGLSDATCQMWYALTSRAYQLIASSCYLQHCSQDKGWIVTNSVL